MAYILRSSTVIRRHWFSGVVTGTPTAQLYVSGVASGSPLVGTGADDAWVFSVPVGALAFGTSVEIWAVGLVGATTERVKLVDGFIADTISDLGDPLVGPFTRTITVTDSVSGDPIEGVSVRLSLAADTESQLTNASGVASFTVSAGTWSYEVFRSGYAGASGSVVVSESGGTAVSLVANAAPPVVTAETTELTFRVSSQGNVSLAGVVASARLTAEGYAVIGSTVGINIVETATSDADGLVTLILFRESDYDLSVQRTNGTIYKIRIRTSDGPSTTISAAIEV